MKLSIQKSNAIGEILAIESDDPKEFVEVYRIADARMLEMNNRILQAAEIQKRYGTEVWQAVREVMDTFFGHRPAPQSDVVAAEARVNGEGAA